MISEKTARALGALGLTGYEAKAYATLVSSGPMSAAGVSSRSGVPYSKVYEVLNGLERKGWIETEHSRPSRFYAKPPSTALDAQKLRLESDRKRNEAQVLGELLPIYERRGTSERPEIWIVRGEHNILGKVKEVLMGCEKELMLATPFGLAALAGDLTSALVPFRDRRGKVMILTTMEAGSSLLAAISRWAEVRVREQMFGGGVISDAREVILLLSGGEGEDSSPLAIWADHPGLARFARNYFEYLWNDSKPFSREV